MNDVIIIEIPEEAYHECYWGRQITKSQEVCRANKELQDKIRNWKILFQRSIITKSTKRYRYYLQHTTFSLF
jgi:hypothetical protein